VTPAPEETPTPSPSAAGRDLQGARIAVVGATGALGTLLVSELSARGARVLAVGRDADRLEALAAEARVVADLGDARAGDDVVHAATEHLGGLDGLVNAAGVVAFGALADTPDEVVEELFLANVVGPLLLLRRVLPLLEESRGFVAQLSAVVAEQPLPRMAAYSASKAALSAAAVALRTELRRSHVDVLDVRPPHTETGLAGRPLSGQAPRLPAGKDPAAVARRVVDAIAAGEQDLGPEAFG
jgi:short-subunit dehydrogenase